MVLSLVQITSHGGVYEITDYKQDANLLYVRWRQIDATYHRVINYIAYNH